MSGGAYDHRSTTRTRHRTSAAKRLRSQGRPVRRKLLGWLTAEEIAQVLPHGPQWVRRHLRRLAHQFGTRDLRWREEVVDEWLQQRGLPPYREMTGSHGA